MLMFKSVLGLQVGWFAAVLGAAHGLPWLGPVVVGILLLLKIHGPWSMISPWRKPLLAILIGTLVDSTFIYLGTVKYREPLLFGYFCPMWIIALWVNFAVAFDGCLAWLKHRYLWAGIFGSAGGPLAYWGAANLGAITLEPTFRALVSLALAWMFATILFAGLSSVPLATNHAKN